MRLITVKYDGQCRNCGKTCRKGERHWYDDAAKKLTCSTCKPLPGATPAGSSTARNCRNCPSFVAAADVANVMKRDAGADMCFRFGHILSRPGQADEVNDHICTETASDCSEFGNERPAAAPDYIAAVVAVGDSSCRPGSEQPPTCPGCSHFVPNHIVSKELGWNLGMCAAKGQLLFPVHYTKEAINCGVSDKGPSRDTTSGVTLFPHFEGQVASVGMPRRRAAYNAATEVERHTIDPRSYETDRPVTPAEEKHLIRAWRRVSDPEGLHEDVYMPIFDGTKLCGYDPRTTYGNHRPDLYIDHASMLYDFAVELIENDGTPLLIGGAGTGKTEAAAWIAWLMDLPFVRISIDKGTESWHLAGESGLEIDPNTGNNVTVWKDGRFAKHWDKPAVITVDEANLKSDVWEFLRPATDSARQLVLDAAQGLKKVRGSHTFLILTQNPSWDPLYVGTEPISAADMDRVSPMYFDFPEPAVERAIIQKHCADAGYDIPAKTLDYIMQIAGDLRRMIYEDHSLPIAWGMRAQIKVAKKTRYFSMEKAYRRAVIDGMEPETSQMVLDTVRSVVGGA